MDFSQRASATRFSCTATFWGMENSHPKTQPNIGQRLAFAADMSFVFNGSVIGSDAVPAININYVEFAPGTGGAYSRKKAAKGPITGHATPKSKGASLSVTASIVPVVISISTEYI